MSEADGQTDEPVDLAQSCQEIQRLLVSLTKTANALPVADFPFLNTFRSFDDHMKRRRNQILAMISDLMKNHTSHSRPFLKATDDQQRFDILCDFNDVILDKVGNALDDAEGLKKQNEALIVATLNLSKRMGDDSQKSMKRDVRLLASKVVERPQTSFADKPDNSHAPFIPKITEKPNSLKPLAILPEVGDGDTISYSHPYEFEIERFEPDDEVLKPVLLSPPLPLESVPLHMIESPSDLTVMMNKLSACREIAVDLEHHNYRSFQGFTCLIQISSRSEDFIIDALKLRSHLSVLNEVFTNPRIVKVFHGADSDVLWLQKDFGVYLVNLFDTFHASKTLSLAHNSLAFLLKLYCNVDADKKYQLSDWRIRPLEEEMIRYARQDTHFLLHVYDKMRNELLAKGNASQNLLRAVFRNSNQVCLKKYEKPVLDKDSHLLLVQKTNLSLNNRQMHALEQIYKWRDRIARQEDEGTGYILPNHMLLQLAQVLPREIQGIVACCQPTPPAVKKNLNELHLILLKSRELPLHVHRDSKKRLSLPIMQRSSTIEVQENHDFDHDVEPHHGLLESNTDRVVSVLSEVPIISSSLFRFFDCKKSMKTMRRDLSFTTPFERFLKSQKDPILVECKQEEMDDTPVKMESDEVSDERANNVQSRKVKLESMEIDDRIRSIRHTEAAQIPEAAAIAPHAYKASDMAIFANGKKQANSGKTRARNRKRKGSGRRDEDEPGTVSYSATTTTMPEKTDFRIAVICSSNQNRSMEAHAVLKKKGFNVRSFGSGNQVKLPGPSPNQPNVYDFSVTYEQMYQDLQNKDKSLYTTNGILHMLDRNRRIKTRPERFQLNFDKFDVIFTCEERVYDQVVEELNNRPATDNSPVHVINIDIQDNHEEATIGSFKILELAEILSQSDDLDNDIDELLQDFEQQSERTILHTIAFQ